jgi:hypothetical protein
MEFAGGEESLGEKESYHFKPPDQKHLFGPELPSCSSSRFGSGVSERGAETQRSKESLLVHPKFLPFRCNLHRPWYIKKTDELLMDGYTNQIIFNICSLLSSPKELLSNTFFVFLTLTLTVVSRFRLL